jgi:hypothetical protein
MANQAYTDWMVGLVAELTTAKGSKEPSEKDYASVWCKLFALESLAREDERASLEEANEGFWVSRPTRPVRP